MLDRTCEHCTSDFRIYAAHARQGRGRYCSKSCADAAKIIGIKRPGKVERRCELCTRVFYTYPAVVRQGRARFCSRPCYWAWQTKFEVQVARFWSHYDKTSECWIWTGDRQKNGYGRYTIVLEGRPRTILCHRLAWALANAQPIPAGLVISHSCDVRLCGNPAHLSAVTQRQNILEMFLRGRNSPHLPTKRIQANHTNILQESSEGW